MGGGGGNFTNYKENEKERNNMMSLLHKRQNACLIKSLISSVTNREWYFRLYIFPVCVYTLFHYF